MAQSQQHRQSVQTDTRSEQTVSQAKKINDERPEKAAQLDLLNMISQSPVQQKAWEDRQLTNRNGVGTVQKADEAPTSPETSPEVPDKDESAKTTSGPDERSKEEMQAAVEAAQEEVEQLVKKSTEMSQVAAAFPMLKEKYQLNDIFFDGIGTDAASVVIEINPRAVVMASGLGMNVTKLGAGRPMGAKVAQDVKFYTATSAGGYKWATKMVAAALGPEHPQGYGPRGLKDQMLPLPTNRSLHPGDNKHYIRGHLLNDNLGGPGSDENMFPITEAANKAHSNTVESVVKSWVNDMGYYIYYSVEVKNINEHIDYTKFDQAGNYVNAQLHVQAYKIAADGSRSSQSSNIKLTIDSKYDTTALTRTDVDDLPDRGSDTPARRQDVVPELSTTKRDGVDYEEIPNWFETELDDAASLMVEQQFKPQTVSTDIFRMIKDATEASHDGLLLVFAVLLNNKTILQVTSGADKTRVWNHAVRSLASKEADARAVLSKFKKIVHTIKKRHPGVRDVLADIYTYRPKSGAEFNWYFTNVASLDTLIPEAMYQGGWKHAHNNYEIGVSLAKEDPDFKRGYDEYIAAIEARRANNALVGTIAQQTATHEYNQTLNWVANDERPGASRGAKSAARDFKSAHDDLLQRGQEQTGAAGVRVKADFLVGYTNARQKGSRPDTVSGKAGYKDYNDALASIRLKAAVGPSPAAQKAKADYDAGVEKLRTGTDVNTDIKGEEIAQTDYDETITKKLAGRAYDKGPATDLASQIYTISKTGLTNGTAFDKRKRGSRRVNGLYTTALDRYARFQGIPDDEISQLAKTQYDYSLAQVRLGEYVNDTRAHRAAFDEYVAGYQDRRRNQNNQNTRAYNAARPDWQRGFNDGFANTGRREQSYGYSVGYTDGTRIRDQHASSNGPSSSKRIRIDPNP